MSQESPINDPLLVDFSSENEPSISFVESQISEVKFPRQTKPYIPTQMLWLQDYKMPDNGYNKPNKQTNSPDKEDKKSNTYKVIK